MVTAEGLKYLEALPLMKCSLQRVFEKAWTLCYPAVCFWLIFVGAVVEAQTPLPVTFNQNVPYVLHVIV